MPALLAFEAVARRRSFALAAAELHLTPSAVSHQVAHLEKLMGVRLFDRSSHGVLLSPVGESYLRRVAGALGAIGAATEDVRTGARDSLYVHSSPSLASLWLMPRLAQFSKEHPGVSLFLSASPTHSDFELGLVDVDIRYGMPNWPNLTVQPLFEERIMPLASPTFIERHRLREPDELMQVPLIQSTVSVVQWSDWFASAGLAHRPDRYALRFDRAYLSLQAAVQGLGIALESTTIARAYLEADQLRPLLDPALSVAVRAHFIVYPARHSERPEVAQFLQWIGSQVAATAGPDPVRPKTSKSRSAQARL